MATIEVLILNHSIELKRNPCHPPKNTNENKADINIMLAYSAKNNNAKDMEEYSTLYPDTSSDSPSVRSKGALLVSAIKDTTNMTAAGMRVNTNKEELP